VFEDEREIEFREEMMDPSGLHHMFHGLCESLSTF